MVKNKNLFVMFTGYKYFINNKKNNFHNNIILRRL